MHRQKIKPTTKPLKDLDFIPDNFDGQSLMIWTEAWNMIWMLIHMK